MKKQENRGFFFKDLNFVSHEILSAMWIYLYLYCTEEIFTWFIRTCVAVFLCNGRAYITASAATGNARPSLMNSSGGGLSHFQKSIGIGRRPCIISDIRAWAAAADAVHDRSLTAAQVTRSYNVTPSRKRRVALSIVLGYLFFFLLLLFIYLRFLCTNKNKKAPL